MNLAGLTQIDVAIYGLVGALLPLLVAVINRPHFPAWAKQIIMLAVAVAVTYGIKNGWDFSSTAGVVTALTGVWIATQGAYLLFWGRGIAPAIEAKVNGSKAAQTDVSPDADAVIDEDVPEVVE
jgi:hypothetical protein